jgi:hypothetical protein
MLGSGEATGEQLFVEGRDRCEHDHHLRGIGCDELLTVLIRPVQQRAAWVDRFDDTLPGRCVDRLDPVAACQQALLPTRKAAERSTALEFNQIVPAVDRDYLAVEQ